MSNFTISGHYVTKISLKQVVGDSYGKVEITFHSQYGDDQTEKFTIDAYSLDGIEIPIEQSVCAYSLKSKVKQLQANKE